MSGIFQEKFNFGIDSIQLDRVNHNQVAGTYDLQPSGRLEAEFP
jgi:hypothetical protein